MRASHFYDGQGFMVPQSLKVAHAKELDGAAVCTASGTTSESDLADFFRANKHFLQAGRLRFATRRATPIQRPLPGLLGRRLLSVLDPGSDASKPGQRHHPPRGDLEGAARARSPAATTSMVLDRQLGALRARRGRREGASPRANAEEKLKSDDPGVQRLLGTQGGLGQKLGLSDDWAYNKPSSRSELRRDLRAQCRRKDAAQAQPRAERASGRRGGRRMYVDAARSASRVTQT